MLEKTTGNDDVQNILVQTETQQKVEQIISTAKAKAMYDAVEKRYTTVKHNKVGRNDLCPCNSGKKFKKCCINKNS